MPDGQLQVPCPVDTRELLTHQRSPDTVSDTAATDFQRFSRVRRGFDVSGPPQFAKLSPAEMMT